MNRFARWSVAALAALAVSSPALAGDDAPRPSR